MRAFFALLRREVFSLMVSPFVFAELSPLWGQRMGGAADQAGHGEQDEAGGSHLR